MGITPPRISDAQRDDLAGAIVGCISRDQADAVINRIWSKLEGDMQDRITSLIYAAQVAVESDGRHLDGVERALKDLAGHEVAATSTKQLKEGPWHGR